VGVLWCPADIASKCKGAELAGGVFAVDVSVSLSTVITIQGSCNS